MVLVKYLNLLTSLLFYIECIVEIPPEILEDCNIDGERPKTYTDVSGVKYCFLDILDVWIRSVKAACPVICQ